jgi:hypothetical protein
LLGVLLLSVAECYSKILDSLDRKAEISGDVDRVKQFRLEDMTTRLIEETSELCSLAVELDLSRWKQLAKKALRAEIYSISKDQRPHSMSVLQHLEHRQMLWHNISSPDFPSIYLDICATDRPVCLVVANESRLLELVAKCS